MLHTRLSSLFCILFSIMLSGEATAHALWAPNGLTPPRDNRDNIKTGPCGNIPRTSAPTYLQSGSTVTLTIESTIYHQGYYRILFSEANDEDFASTVLADNIPDVQGQNFFQQSVTLPNIECDDCTLQMIQVMEDRTPPSNYFSCADIALTSDGLPPSEPGDSVPPSNVSNVVSNTSATSASFVWTNPVDNDLFRVLITQAGSDNSGTPMPGINYLVGDTIGNAEVVYIGSGSSFNQNNLSVNTDYFFKFYAYDNSLNYASGIEISAHTGIMNSAPEASLTVEQDSRISTSVLENGGLVVVQATAVDADSNDTHTYDWSGTDSSLVDTDPAPANFSFLPASLAAGNYTVRVMVSDNGSPPLNDSSEITITVAANSATSETPSEDQQQSNSSGGGSFGWLLALSLLFVAARAAREYHCDLKRHELKAQTLSDRDTSV